MTKEAIVDKMMEKDAFSQWLGIEHLEASDAFEKWSDALDMIKAKLDSSDD